MAMNYSQRDWTVAHVSLPTLSKNYKATNYSKSAHAFVYHIFCHGHIIGSRRGSASCVFPYSIAADGLVLTRYHHLPRPCGRTLTNVTSVSITSFCFYHKLLYTRTCIRKPGTPTIQGFLYGTCIEMASAPLFRRWLFCRNRNEMKLYCLIWLHFYI